MEPYFSDGKTSNEMAFVFWFLYISLKNQFSLYIFMQTIKRIVELLFLCAYELDKATCEMTINNYN
jgi:hypothetical protein